MTLTSSGVSTPDPDRPLRADAERNRRRILAAAAELFAQRGLEVGLDEIARQAGVGTATVYRRFPEKSVLIEALFEDRIEAMIRLDERACADPDPWTGLVTMLEGMAQMQLENRGLKELVFSAACPGRALPDRRTELVPLIGLLVRRAQASGQLRADLDPTDIAMIQVMLNACGAFAGAADPQLWRRHLGLILDGLRTRRDEPSPLPAGPLALHSLEELCGVRPR